MIEDLKQIKEKVMELWNASFNDSEAFTALYFEKRYADDRNIFVEKEGMILSALQMIPYPMTYYGGEINTSYVSGACTDPAYRGIGMMTQLLTDTLKEMHRNGVQLATLIPAETSLQAYYNRFGFTRLFDYSIRHFRKDEFSNVQGYAIVPYTEYREEVYEYFNRKMRERPLCIQHTSDDLDFIWEAFKQDGNAIFIARQNNKIKGSLFCTPGSGSIVVKELLCDSEYARDALITHALQCSGAEFVRYIDYPGEGAEDYALGMARVLDVHLLLRRYAQHHPEVEIRLQVADNIISENNSSYYMNNGDCIKMPGTADESYLPVTIDQLTRLLMGYHIDEMEPEFRQFAPAKPYMSLMVND